MNKIEHKEFIEKLIAFLEEGFQNPINIINYLQSRDKCNKLKCETKDCKALIKYLTDNKSESPWSLKLLDKFDESRRQWYKPRLNYWEEPLNAFFTLPRIAQFLEEEMKLSSEEIIEVFKMEYKGLGEKEIFVPKCLWKGKKEEWTGIPKEFNGGKRMCCDFYFKNYKKNKKSIPNLVGEIKFAIPHQRHNVWNEYKKDIEKCTEWVKMDTTPYLVERFNIIKFDYALGYLNRPDRRRNI